MIALGVAACSDSGQSDGGNGPSPPPGSGGSRDFSASAVAVDYIDYVAQHGPFDECFGTGSARCPRGPRTGTLLGEGTHDWIADYFRAIPGLDAPRRIAFDLPGFRPLDVALEVQGLGNVPAFPWYYSGHTNSGDIEAPLVDGDPRLLDLLLPGALDGAIALISADRLLNAESPQARRRLEAAAEAGAAAAIVYFPSGPDDALPAHNHDIAEGYGSMPTLLVSADDGRRLRQALGQQARLRLQASTAGITAHNTVSRLPGTDRSRQLVIATPMNSWLSAGAERAPGIGILVELAATLAARAQRDGPFPFDIVFAATGAHEIYGFGAERLLRCFDQESVVSYLHLGAGLVSREWRRPLLGGGLEETGRLSPTRTVGVSENLLLRTQVGTLFANPDLSPIFDLPPSVFNPGEGRVGHELGVPTVAMSGTNAYHHSSRDDSAQIAFDALPVMADAWLTLVERLLAVDPQAMYQANAAARLLANDPMRFPCAGS